jgi:hypothetical protein
MGTTKVTEDAKPKIFTKVRLCKEISNATDATNIAIERKVNDLLEYTSPSMLYAHQAHHQRQFAGNANVEPSMAKVTSLPSH